MINEFQILETQKSYIEITIICLSLSLLNNYKVPDVPVKVWFDIGRFEKRHKNVSLNMQSQGAHLKALKQYDLFISFKNI